MQHRPRKNGWTDWAAVWDAEWREVKEWCIRWVCTLPPSAKYGWTIVSGRLNGWRRSFLSKLYLATSLLLFTPEIPSTDKLFVCCIYTIRYILYENHTSYRKIHNRKPFQQRFKLTLGSHTGKPKVFSSGIGFNINGVGHFLVNSSTKHWKLARIHTDCKKTVTYMCAQITVT